MQATIGNTLIRLTVGDITKASTDAIVNAANSNLTAGGGVCGAIFDACGKVPFDECASRYDGCETGGAVITSGGRMSYKVIHAVGPMFPLDRDKVSENQMKSFRGALDAAYWNSLVLAEDNGLESISFPSLSTGIYGFPLEEASLAALRSIREFVEETEHTLTLVQFILFSADNYQAYSKAMAEVLGAENVREMLSADQLAQLSPPRPKPVPMAPKKAKQGTPNQNFKGSGNHSKVFGQNKPSSSYLRSESEWGGLFDQIDNDKAPIEDVGDGFTVQEDREAEYPTYQMFLSGKPIATVKLTSKGWVSDWDSITPKLSRHDAIEVVKSFNL